MRLKSVKCPHCAVATAISPVWIKGQGILHGSLGEVKAEVSIEAVVREGAYGSPPIWAISECRSCGKFFVVVEGYRGLDAVFPIPRRPVAEEIAQQVRAAFEDALLCLAVGALGGCLMMCRTTLIRIQRDKAKLKELRDIGQISDLLYQQADEVRLWANMVGHEDIPLEQLTREDCEELADYIEAMLDAIYVQPARLAKHREARKDLQNGN